MDLSPVAQMLALTQTQKSGGKPTEAQATSHTPAHEATVSMSASFEAEFAMNLRIRIQLNQPQNAPVSHPAPGAEEEAEEAQAPSRREVKRATRSFLRGVNRSVRRELKEFLKNAEHLDREDRVAIRDLAKSFRKDLRQAYRAGFGDGRTDLDAVAAGVQEAFGNLVEGLQGVAAQAVENDDEARPRELRMARRFLVGLNRSVRHQIRSAIKHGDFSESQVEELKDLARGFKHDLRKTFRNSVEDGRFSARDFLGGLTQALDRLSEGLKAFLPAAENLTTDPGEPVPVTDPKPTTEPATVEEFAAYA